MQGVLLPIFSLPGHYGIGRFGSQAYRWINDLKSIGMNTWQICPLGPTGFGNSPYQPLSEMALNPLFIDIEDLIQRGWLYKNECVFKKFSPENTINYEAVKMWQTPLLLKAYNRFLQQKDHNDFHHFKVKQSDWLDVFATYCALKEKFNGRPWWEWPPDFRKFDTPSVCIYKEHNKNFVDFFSFQQWILAEQWQKIHRYAHANGICIVGDIPLYVGHDSAVVWQNRLLFDWNDEKDCPAYVAGVPPDYFSPNGQLWGNPLYNWNYHQQTDFAWWVQRMQKNFKWYDVLRLDHFRGFYDYWAVPYGEKIAKKGHWRLAPAEKFFKTLRLHWPYMPFILEDLGNLNGDVKSFQTQLHIPGMVVMQFAFTDGNNPYLPKNWQPNSVIYTGTHDNNTTRGWFSSLDKKVRTYIRNMLHHPYLSEKTISENLTQYIFKHVTTQHVIITLQDVLNLGSEARINTPGTLENNWTWRMQEKDFYVFLKNVKNFFHETKKTN